MKIISLFSGVGGIDLAFENTGFFKTIYANEFDPYPAKTFESNFKNIKVNKKDLCIKISCDNLLKTAGKEPYSHVIYVDSIYQKIK